MRTLRNVLLVIGAVFGLWFAWHATRLTPRVEGQPLAEQSPIANKPLAQAESSTTRTALAKETVAEQTAPLGSSAPVVTHQEEASPEEIALLETETPPGTIEGIVLRGRTPVSTGGRVYYQPGMFVRFPEDTQSNADIQSALIGPDGIFRIQGVKSGPVTLAVDLGEGLLEETAVQVQKVAPGRRVVVVIGSARLHGHVYDDDGLPMTRALIVISRNTTRRGSFGIFRTVRFTGSDGAYEFSDLTSGSYTLKLDRKGRIAQRTERDATLPFSLGVGEDRTMDFGSPTPAIAWQGTLRRRSGEPVHGPGKLRLVSKEGRVETDVPFDAAGAINGFVREGHFEVGVEFTRCNDHRWNLPDLQFSPGNPPADLVVECPRVIGVVVDAATGEPWKREDAVRVSVHRPSVLALGCSADVGRDGSFVIDGLQPGEYVPNVDPFLLLEGTLPIVISAADEDVRVRLVVRDP